MLPSRISELVSQVERGSLSRRAFLSAAAAIGVSASVGERALATGSRTLDARRLAAQAQAEEGIVTISNENQATYQRNLNPLGAAGLSVRPATSFTMYEGLIVWNGVKRQAEAALATGWQFSEDNRQLTFNLREGVKWSDGEAFDASDVIFTWDLFTKHDGLGGNGARSALPYLDSWEAVDDLTVRFTFSEVFTPGFYYIGEQVIVPEHVWKDVEDPVKHTNETPVATGPMTEIVNWSPQSYTLGVNPNFRYLDRMKIKGAKFPALTDNAAVGLALTNGELDWSNTFLPDIQNTYVAKDPEHFGYWFPPIGGATMLWLNTTKAPYDDVNVRKALSMGIDRQEIVDIAMFGYTPPADETGISQAFEAEKNPDAIATGWATFDVDAANAMLDEAGMTKDGDFRKLPDGSAYEPKIMCVGSFSDYMQAAQLIEEGFVKIGINATIDSVEFGDFQTRSQQADYDMCILWSNQGPTVYQFFRSTMSTETATPRAGFTAENYGRVGLPEADDLLNAYATTSDPDEQLKLSHQLQMLFAENVPCLPLFYAPIWNEYNTMRYDGHATEDRPYTSPSPTGSTGMTVLMHLHPVGEEMPDYSDVITPTTAMASPVASPEATPMD